MTAAMSLILLSTLILVLVTPDLHILRQCAKLSTHA